MELETYLCGVVLAEMPAEFEMEALKAQSVVARTYALRRLEQGTKHPQGAVCLKTALQRIECFVKRHEKE